MMMASCDGMKYFFDELSCLRALFPGRVQASIPKDARPQAGSGVTMISQDE
jgi:hypothetical protein